MAGPRLRQFGGLKSPSGKKVPGNFRRVGDHDTRVSLTDLNALVVPRRQLGRSHRWCRPGPVAQGKNLQLGERLLDCSTPSLHMSAFGPKRTSLVAPHMSAFRGKADIAIALRMSAYDQSGRAHGLDPGQC